MERGCLKRTLNILCFCNVLFFLMFGNAQSSPDIPNDILAYPVLLVDKAGNTGSGFFYDKGGFTYLITARRLETKLPLLRKGIVAGKNESLDAIILDCPAYGGNSGGLVMEAEKVGSGMNLRAIGIITNFVPFTGNWLQNSGYSIVVPMNFVDELITGKM